ncbi:MAG: hypothetical protein AAFO94_04330, partial [Bacteroidota bacterium]
MKNLLALLFCVSILGFMACEKENTNSSELELHHDGPNQSAPFFEPGMHIAAARFNANDVLPYEGKNLEAVEFYFLALPDKAEVQIYGVGTGTEPGALLYSADVTSAAQANAWTRHELTTPLQLDGDDIWIGIMVENASRATIMGCDPGQADPNGDWTFSTDNNTWQTFRDRTNGSVD